MAQPLAEIEGKYEIVAKIKEGGMGAIYRVRHRLLDEIRVVKVLRPQHEDDEELRARFAREARSAIRLRHPNVVQIFDFSIDEAGAGLIVMEHIEGVDLEHLVRLRRLPSLPLALEVARQSLRALGFLHSHGFVHRDVSPDNLMLTHDVDGLPLMKLIDLGIAKRLDAEQQLTVSGSFLGKFRYASPEHFGARGEDGLDHRSDLYSFGLVFYELLTGHFPLVAASTSQLIGAHLFHTPRPFAETDPAGRVPEAVQTMVLRALDKSADKRPENAKAWIEEIETLQRAMAPEKDLSRLRAELSNEAAALATATTLPADAARQPGATQRQFDERFHLGRTPSPSAIRTSSSRPESSVGAAADTEALGALVEGAAKLQERERGRAIEQIERHVISALRRSKLGRARRDVLRAREAYGDDPVFDTLDEILDGAAAEKVEALRVEARNARQRGEWAEAEDKLEAAEALVQDAGAERDTVRRELEQLRADRRRAERSRVSSGGLLAAVAEIERLRMDEGPEAARRALDEAIFHFGEASLLREVRAGLENGGG